MTKFMDIIAEICNEQNIKLTTISQGWIHILEKNNQIHYINGYKFELNNSSISNILDDKYAFFELMEYKRFPIIKHIILHKNYSKDLVCELFNKYNARVVVKSNLGTCGREVFYIDDINELYNITDNLLISNYSVSICPFVEIKNEYRSIVLDNEVKLLYKKERPVVYGDGKSSVKDLLVKFNPHYFKDKELPNDILPAGKKYEYNWQFNLSNGATMSKDIDKSLKDKLIDLTLNITKSINIRFCSIDIIEDEFGGLYLMEGNSGVMMENFIAIEENGYAIAKSIYNEAINKMFEE